MKPEFIEKISKCSIVVIKVGSARVSGDRRQVNDFLYDLTGSVRKLRDSGKKVILVSSGAIAQGKSLYEMNYPPRLWNEIQIHEKQALAAMGQSRLMNLYDHFFSLANIPVAQILFGKNDILSSEGHKNLTSTVKTLLDWGILPIVNENDSIATEELNLGDNDLLSAMVASLIPADLLIILTGVDGYIRGNAVVPFLETVEDSEFQYALGPSGPGRGGMNTKLKAAKILLNFGIMTAILNGTRKNTIDLLFSGTNTGTLIGRLTEMQGATEFEEWRKRFFQND